MNPYTVPVPNRERKAAIPTTRTRYHRDGIVHLLASFYFVLACFPVGQVQSVRCGVR
jgi:hypothetical protein